MKVTESKDGTKRTTLFVKHRMSRDEMILVLCLWVVKGGVEKEALPRFRLTQDGFKKAVKETLAQFGYDAPDWWSDSLDDEDDYDLVRDWAAAQVDRHLPGFTA